MIEDIFVGQSIAITGASGFIGSALFSKLKSTDCEIILISREKLEIDKTGCRANIRILMGDLTDTEFWQFFIDEVDVVIHLSAMTNLYSAEKNPDESRKINVSPVLGLLRYLEKKPKPDLKLIFASAATIVGVDHPNPVDESFPDHPITVYDQHKKKVEELLRAASKKHLLQTCSLRLANVYGYGKKSKNTERGVLNLIMNKALRGEDLSIYGDGTGLRDFIHIDDVVDAFILSIGSQVPAQGEVYYISSGSGHTLKHVFGVVAKVAENFFGQTIKLVMAPEPEGYHPIEKRSFIGDSSLFQCLTGWSPRYCLEERIEMDMLKFQNERKK